MLIYIFRCGHQKAGTDSMWAVNVGTETVKPTVKRLTLELILDRNSVW